MANPEDKPDETPPQDTPSTTTTDRETRLALARRFLDDGSVKTASRERKAEFLRSKDISDEDINDLLREETADEPTKQEQQEQEPSSAPFAEEIHDDASSPPTTKDRPPIITYPEYLSTPSNPPLLTPSTVLTSLSVFAGLATLLYGTNKHYLEPQLASQTSARHSYLDTVSSSLTTLITKLESTVSTLPPPPAAADTSYESDDPSELFHRDMGTQTSSVPTPKTQTTPTWNHNNHPNTSSEEDNNNNNNNVLKQEVQVLTDLTRAVTNWRDETKLEHAEWRNLRTLLDTFRDGVRDMSTNKSYGGGGGGGGGGGAGSGDEWTSGPLGTYHPGFGVRRPRGGEEQDEIEKLRDSVRRLKGVFLSKQNFPGLR